MTINYSILVKHFNGDFAGIAENVLMRMDDRSSDELWQAMDDELIYTCDQWAMIEYYCTPQNADFESAWTEFYNDLMNAIDDGILEDD